MGSCLPPICLDCRAAGDFDFIAAGCFPLFEEVAPTGGFADGVEAGLGEDVL